MYSVHYTINSVHQTVTINWDAIQNIGERAPVLGSRFGTSRTPSCRFVGPLSTVRRSSL